MAQRDPEQIPTRNMSTALLMDGWLVEAATSASGQLTNRAMLTNIVICRSRCRSGVSMRKFVDGIRHTKSIESKNSADESAIKLIRSLFSSWNRIGGNLSLIVDIFPEVFLKNKYKNEYKIHLNFTEIAFKKLH